MKATFVLITFAVVVVGIGDIGLAAPPTREAWSKVRREVDTAACEYRDGACVPDFVVTAPGTWSGNTCGAGNDCTVRPSEERVYEVTLAAGMWTFDLCDSSYDTYVFVGTTPGGDDVGANDDACGFQSKLTADLAAGTYYVTIEGFTGNACGDYVLAIYEDGGGCCGEAGTGDCCEATGSPCCEDANCCATVCAADPHCCDVEWDQACADATSMFPAECMECAEVQCGSWGTGTCCEATGSPYCEEAECCEAVCAADPHCCEVEWDQACADATSMFPDECVCGGPCVADFVVSGPGSWPDSTCGAGNDCTARASEEHVYEVTLVEGTWTFDLCDSSYDTYVFVGTTPGGDEVGANDDACGFQSKLTADLAASTYYVTIEGFTADACGDYVLAIYGSGRAGGDGGR